MTLPELPKDLVEEILSFVPATSPKRLRSTCKGWNRLFKDDKRFTRKHTEKAAKQFQPLTLTKNYRICPINVNLHGTSPSLEVKNEVSLLDPHSKNSAPQFNIDRVFHCDGLLLCTSQKDSRFVVWNPLTGVTKWIELGDRYNEGMAFILGYDNKSCNKSYKAMSFNYLDKDSEIYEFSSDSWRVIDDIIKPPHYMDYFRECFSLKGNTYWLGIDRRRRPPDLRITLIKFDFGTEKFGYVSLPPPCQVHGFEASNLSVVGDKKLSVLVHPRLSFLLDEEKKVFLCCKSKGWMEEEDEDNVYIVGEDNKFILLNFGVETIGGESPIIINYVPSLVQIELAGSKRKTDY
ncbi:unnamed protein product [Arabidopsis thaliana]|uniref:F-box domain-containing protein n=1 Tax=Arabidopsis thaliana TaxID=3702 RepID=A0A5S9WXK7_ARATH|nr:unnamed protein product [Arabidopsis thaliana]